MPFTVADIAHLCEAVYYKDLNTRLSEWIPSGVAERIFDDGRHDTLTAAGTGFHGACYVKDEQAVVAFAGTNPKSGKDLAADIGMVFGNVPEQAKRAADLLQTYGSWAQTQGVQQFIVAGHSLGGAMGQLIATASGLPFVTFNAYGAEKLAKDSTNSAIAQVAKWGKDEAKGLSIRDSRDVISFGGEDRHLGKVVSLNLGTSFFSRGKAHSMGGLAKGLREKYPGEMPFIDEPFVC